jgi:hypothetical protein
MSENTNNDDLALPTPPPESLKTLPLAALREHRNRLTEEEEKVSYWRRLIQFRLNLIKTQKQAGVVSTKDLMHSLGSTGSGHRRQQLLSVDAQEELPQLPGLDELWTSAIDPSDEEGTLRLVEELNSVERRLSDYRRMLHTLIDSATAELISRYKADPNLSLELFPEDVR